MRYFFSIVFSMVALVSAAGATFMETFSSEPNVWRTHNPGAVIWDASAGNVAVTWDSRQTNSFFYYKLPMTLTRRDTFAMEFTLRLDDVTLGINPAKPQVFQLCAGFLNIQEATRTNYFRGSGAHPQNGPRSVVEFAYFPEGVFDPTIGPIIASTNNQIQAAHSFPVELTPGETFRIRMAFDAAAQTLSTTIAHNGQPYGEPPTNTIRPLLYPESFGDFRIDAFSIHSYSDAGQSPPQFAGSVLAHGAIDDVVITWPEPPLEKLAIEQRGRHIYITFDGDAGWFYTLERTTDFVEWEIISREVGLNGLNEIYDADPPIDRAFYRVLAERE